MWIRLIILQQIIYKFHISYIFTNFFRYTHFPKVRTMLVVSAKKQIETARSLLRGRWWTDGRTNGGLWSAAADCITPGISGLRAQREHRNLTINMIWKNPDKLSVLLRDGFSPTDDKLSWRNQIPTSMMFIGFISFARARYIECYGMKDVLAYFFNYVGLRRNSLYLVLILLVYLEVSGLIFLSLNLSFTF